MPMLSILFSPGLWGCSTVLFQLPGCDSRPKAEDVADLLWDLEVADEDHGAIEESHELPSMLWTIFRMDMGFYIGIIVRALLESLQKIHVLLANQTC